jgi:two-component system NtrC family sensor kinase
MTAEKFDDRKLTIGVISPYLGGYYFSEIMTELHRYAHSIGMRMLSIRAGRRDPLSIPLASDLVHGWIIIKNCISATHLNALLDSGKPVVSIACDFDHPRITSVQSDIQQATTEAVHFLINAGYRNIAHVDMHNDSGHTHHLPGFRDALSKHGITPSLALEITTDGFGYADGKKAAHQLLMSSEQFNAVIACSDLLAAGVIDGLKEAHIRIPEDVAVIGNSNIALSRLSTPSIATIDQNIGQVAETALQRICQQITSGTQEGGTVAIPSTFVPRVSCNARLRDEQPEQMTGPMQLRDVHVNEMNIGYEVTKDLISADFDKVLERMQVLAPYLEWACIGQCDDPAEQVHQLQIHDIADLQTESSQFLLHRTVPITSFPPLDHLENTVAFADRFVTVVPILFSSKSAVLAVTGVHSNEAEIERYGTLMHYIDLLSLALERSLLDQENLRRENSYRELAEKLDQANQLLEERVRTRTLSLERSNQELSELNAKLSQAQEQLVQSDKLASIGQLAAGVAHEINNPIGFVHSNFSSLGRYLDQVFTMLATFEQAQDSLTDETIKEKIATVRDEIELDYLKEDIPVLMEECKDGLARVRKIVQDLKDFSHADSSLEWQWTDLHRNIDSTLNIINSEIKYRADVVREYGQIPEVQCLPSQINQVVMNLVINSAHAMEQKRGTITLRTGTEGDQVWIEIADQGCGIPKENLQRIFDPFFTTKPVGKGTGLGLSLSYGIIQRHQGSITVQSEVGKGTTFRITLPVKQSNAIGSGADLQKD